MIISTTTCLTNKGEHTTLTYITYIFCYVIGLDLHQLKNVLAKWDWH